MLLHIFMHIVHRPLIIIIIILTAWDKMDQRIIDKAVRQWRTRLRACVTGKGHKTTT